MAFIISLLLFAPMILLGGYTFSTLWGWFIVPVFAAPALTVMQAAGLMLVKSFLFFTLRDLNKAMERKSTVATELRDAAIATMFCGMVLGFGWLYLQVPK